MKRFITLLLMLSTLLTFMQKATAFAPLLENETTSMANCSMSVGVNEANLMQKTDCAGAGDEMSHSMDCQNDCAFMTVVSVLYFIDHDLFVNQPQLRLPYQTADLASPYYFPESLYRPPFLS